MDYKILIVDDEPANLRTMERLFRGEHEVLTASSGTAALELISRNDIALIVSDQRMPVMTGIEFLKKAAEIRPQTVRIILSSYTDISDLVEAINSGVIYKYITKPWVNADLVQTVHRAVEHYEVTKKQHLLEQENRRLEIRLESTRKGFILAVNELIAQKNQDIAAHCRRTSKYAVLIGKAFGFEGDEIDNLAVASMLHEISNSRISLDFETAMTVEEHRLHKTSFENGLRLISSVPDMEGMSNIIRFQYERFDGKGFFAGLDGEKIPLNSRILAVANAFDEINSGRRPELLCTDEEAAEWLRERAGSHFDPTVVEVCIETCLIAPFGIIMPSVIRDGPASFEMVGR